MDHTWILFALLVSVVSLASYIPRQYHFVNQNKTWTDAQSYCRQTYTDLATINNPKDMDAVSATFQNNSGSHAWIGLKKGDGQQWKWSLQGGIFFIVGQSYTNWHPGEPNNVMHSNACAYIRGDGTWTDDHCTKIYPFVCYTGKKTSPTQLVLVTDQKNFSDAQMYCSDQYTNLPSVRNHSENQKIQQVAQGGVAWIGLFRDSWEWSGQTNSTYRNWRPGQPNDIAANENCVALFISGQNIGTWEDWPCQNNFPFICYEDQLILIKQNLTWREALRYCRDNHVDLVSIHSEEIQLWVEEVARKASTDLLWLGLRHTCVQGFWYWLNGSPMCYQNWAPGNGTGGEDCSSGERSVAVQSRGERQWVSLPETRKLNFICTTYED